MPSEPLQPEPSPRYDVIIVGAGFAGGALASRLASNGVRVLLLERQETHKDLVRGEWLAPWGVQEARMLGIEDAFLRAGAWTIERWVQWDETVDPYNAPAWDLADFTFDVAGPMSFRHHRICEEVCRQARDQGADIRMGVREITFDAAEDQVHLRWRQGDSWYEAGTRFLVGASGRANLVGKRAGIELEYREHHWGGGIAVEGLDTWPENTQAMGTEGQYMFFVFPQGGGKARLYLNFATENRRRFTGPGSAERFLQSFDFTCFPSWVTFEGIRPTGPFAIYPSRESWTKCPVRGPIVLIGDEAGNTDPVLGAGLATSLRDARLVAEAIQGHEGASDPFGHYIDERAERIRRLRIAADVESLLLCEFGDGPRARRADVWRRASEDFRLASLMLAKIIAPEHLPEFAFHPLLRERLLGRETSDRLRSLELVAV